MSWRQIEALDLESLTEVIILGEFTIYLITYLVMYVGMVANPLFEEKFVDNNAHFTFVHVRRRSTQHPSSCETKKQEHKLQK